MKTGFQSSMTSRTTGESKRWKANGKSVIRPEIMIPRNSYGKVQYSNIFTESLNTYAARLSLYRLIAEKVAEDT